MLIEIMVTDNDGVNIDSETKAMSIMNDEGRQLIGDYCPELLKNLPEDHIYKTFPGKSTDKIVKAIIVGDWDKTDNGNIDRALPLPLICQDLGFDCQALGFTEDEEVQIISEFIADKITRTTIERFDVELTVVPGTIPAWKEIATDLGPQSLYLATTSDPRRMDTIDNATDPETGENAGLGNIFPKGPHRYSGYGTPNKYNSFFATPQIVGELPEYPRPNLPKEARLSAGAILDLENPAHLKIFLKLAEKDPNLTDTLAKYKEALQDSAYLAALAKYDEAYEKAEKRYIDPAKCAIVEDSDSGAGYAKEGRPNTKVIGTVAAKFFVDKDAQAIKLMAKGADIVISTMYDLPKAKEWLNNGLTLETKPDFIGKIYTPAISMQLEAAPSPPSMG